MCLFSQALDFFMSYLVKEMFVSLQGEGVHTGMAAVFCRFSGCNLWNGREENRKNAVCGFCDTDIVGTDGPGGGKFASAKLLADILLKMWGKDRLGIPFIICTGGEPLLQLDIPLIDALHNRGFKIAVETNGTQMPPTGIDWLCVSPKARAPLLAKSGNELKLVFPQPEAMPEQFEHLQFDHFFLQPLDGPDLSENTRNAITYCMQHPKWRLSLQTHKILGIP